MTRPCLTVLSACCSIALIAQRASAAPQLLTFNITSGSLTLGGQFGSNTPSPQTGTTFSVGYTGTVVAEIDHVANTIRFLGDSQLIAGLQPVNVEPEPDSTPGTDPGNYGREGNVNVFGTPVFGVEAIRSLILDVENASLGTPINYSPSTGQFASGDIGILVDQGTADFAYGTVAADADLSGGAFASNGASTPSTLVSDGTTETLTLQFQTGAITHSVFSAGDSSMTFTGTVVATRVVPEPAAAGVVALAGVTLLARRRRRSA